MGVTYDNEKQMFVFDFEHDGVEDIVKLTGDGYQVEAFGKCFLAFFCILFPQNASKSKAPLPILFQLKSVGEGHFVIDCSFI